MPAVNTQGWTVVQMIPADGWAARVAVQGGNAQDMPLVAWALVEDGSSTLPGKTFVTGLVASRGGHTAGFAASHDLVNYVHTDDLFQNSVTTHRGERPGNGP